MTGVVGLVHEGLVYIGADSAGVSNLDLTIRRDPKVFTVGDFVIGYSYSFRMGQILMYEFEPPTFHPDEDVFKYMVTSVVSELRRVFKEGGFAEKNNEREIGGAFLVGFRGRLFSIASDYQVGESLDSFDAVGSGEHVLLGSMYTSDGLGWLPKKRITVALQAAERHNAGVRGPFLIMNEPGVKAIAASSKR